MIITVAGFKGGVGKSITAIHLAAYLQIHGSTVLIDGDPNRSALSWSERGGETPFIVVDEDDTGSLEEFDHIVIDTPARPSEKELQGLAEAADLLVLPTTVDAFGIDALVRTINHLEQIPRDRYRVLLTIVPPLPNKDGEKARVALEGAGLPLFNGCIMRRIAFQKSSLEGTPVYGIKDARAAQAWEDYKNIGDQIIP